MIKFLKQNGRQVKQSVRYFAATGKESPAPIELETALAQGEYVEQSRDSRQSQKSIDPIDNLFESIKSEEKLMQSEKQSIDSGYDAYMKSLGLKPEAKVTESARKEPEMDETDRLLADLAKEIV